MVMPAGLLSTLMSGGPLPIPKIPCGRCVGMGRAVDDAEQAVTLVAGTLVCAPHAEDVTVETVTAAAIGQWIGECADAASYAGNIR